MKKVFMIIAVTGLLLSCGNNTKKESEEKASVEEFSEIAKNVVDSHNAKNSLDYKGEYKGKVPTASGEGMIVSITLSDSSFVKKVEYVGKKGGKFEEKGKYTWNAEGNTVILDGIKDAPNKYFVGENTLTQLDMDGNKITGANADMYILKK
ncbi:copper resistance protein NlpE [Dysgonomonas sp. 511]|uniref:copper resistance protein NlpE n=1 Tax=Dysgonomonas sp. 511 TaxID=2302930 RepID=UPI0013D0F5EA|nr:copper resistance protein NlpE [Dysgonomonas sp. 511]NDV78911.1 copper resistance protein NlpE [Dysgonomonas sp. 511]